MGVKLAGVNDQDISLERIPLLLRPLATLGSSVLSGLIAAGGVGLLLVHTARQTPGAYFRDRGRRLA